MTVLRGYLADFVSLLFPRLCPACGESLMGNEDLLCTECLYALPQTHFHQHPDNIVAQQFWGKIQLQGVYSLYYFAKGGKVQNLMHHFKYSGMPRIGNVLGNIAGNQLAENDVFQSADVIIPVPLHKKRLKERGYNQSACFAQGIAEKLHIPVEENNLVRLRSTETQTHKSRFARYENMMDVFSVQNPEKLKGKHILLVDDVITTGSTLEACGIELLKIPGSKLSIATIAYAE